MTSGERALWFIWNRRLDGEGSLCWNDEDWAVSLVRHCDPTLETPTVTYRCFRREGLTIPPYITFFSTHNVGTLVPCLCLWARHFSLTCFTWLRCKWVPGIPDMAMCTISSMHRNDCRARILVQVTIYRRRLIGRDGYLDQSEAYDISYLVQEYRPDCLLGDEMAHEWTGPVTKGELWSRMISLHLSRYNQ